MDSLKISHLLSAFCLFLLIFLPVVTQGGGGGVFRVKRKFNRDNINILKQHDEHRHSRVLAGKPVDVYLGGNLTTTATWYTEVAIGTPPKIMTVYLDTGSDLFWVYCEGCKDCPIRNESLGIKLSLYDPNVSESARIVEHDESICNEILLPPYRLNHSKGSCGFNMSYLEGSFEIGYLVTDLVNFNHVSGDQQYQPAKANIIFGCATQLFGTTELMKQAHMKSGREGFMGFGTGNATVISQMAKSGKVRNEFAHCLDADGGIFAIGHVVHPKVDMVPLYQAEPYHYKIMLESIEVDGQSIKRDLKAHIDSGCTLAYFPKEINDFLVEKVLSKHSNLSFYTDGANSTCFHYSGRADEDFPVINFQFGKSLTLKAYPHDYFLPDLGNEKPLRDSLCIGWRASKDFTIFGDLFLRNKVVVYDRENKRLGWKEYNCSASIAVEDETNGGVCTINAHNFTAKLND